MVDSNKRFTTQSLQCPMENVSSQLQSLDTVRALHQTVVSLRSALEEAKFEIQRLRNQISAQSDITEGAKEKQQIKTLKNVNIIQQQQQEQQRQKEFKKQKEKLKPKVTTIEIVHEKDSLELDKNTEKQHQIQHTRLDEIFDSKEESKSTFSDPFHHHCHHHKFKADRKLLRDHHKKILISPNISIIHYPTNKRNIENFNSSKKSVENDTEMGSKIDVKIKVMSNIKVDNSSNNSSFSNDSEKSSNSGNSGNDDEKNENGKKIPPDAQQEEKTTTTKKDNRFHLQTKTEDKISIQRESDGTYAVTQSSKENLNIDDNDENSQSENGDNSVFIEEEEKDGNDADQKRDEKLISEKSQTDTDLSLSQHDSKELNSFDKDQENKEEVDDIELIFSSEETRDPIQEDLVSISEYDPWQQPGQSGTPVLVKFSSLPSSSSSSAAVAAVTIQNDNEMMMMTKKEILNGKLSTSTTYDAFLESTSADAIHIQRQKKRIESVDSLDTQRNFKSSSLETDNSDGDNQNNLQLSRDESLDFFNLNNHSSIGGGSRGGIGIVNSSGEGTIGGINRKWTNYNVLVETDISKCGIVEETTFEMMYRRNTCPNPPAYRPFALRDYNNTRPSSRITSSSKYSRRLTCNHQHGPGQISRPVYCGTKRSSPAQTNISALPAHWKSESQLIADHCHLGGPCTLPSKFVTNTRIGCPKHFSRISERTQEARRILLSDINFTSMVPELSRSADHLCQDENKPTVLSETSEQQSPRYYKGNLLKTPDYALKGMTPSVSMTSPGASQWTVNESSFGTQTIQTGESWGGKRGDSFDSCKSYSTGGGFRYSNELNRHHRSRSVPSVRCAICKQSHHGIKASESMHYTPRVTFQESGNAIRGSLPDLRHDCTCSRRYCGGRTIFPIHGDSGGSTESLLDEADAFIRKSMDVSLTVDDNFKRSNFRRMSENDIQKDYIPSRQSLPFLPKTAKCLKPGHLAKVIAKNGRVVIGRVRYVGPLISKEKPPVAENKILVEDLYVGVQLQSKCGDCDGTFEGRKFFDCEPHQGLFIPFKKVVMAWTS